MKVELYKVYGQVYITPYIKVTHDRVLNGNIELIIGWLKRELVFKLWS